MTDIMSTGVPFLDKELDGGLPKGFTVLLYGPPGSGMELFAKQFAHAGGSKETVVYFSTTERDRDVKGTMKRYGWNEDIQIVNLGTIYYENVLARQLEVSKYRQEGLTLKDIRGFTSKKQDRDSINFLTNLTYEVSKLQPPFRVIIDSLDFFLEHYMHNSVLSALRTIKAHTQHNESIALVTMLKDVYETRTQSGVEGIVDCIMELETRREGDKIEHYLLINKVRNLPEKVEILRTVFTKEGFSAKE